MVTVAFLGIAAGLWYSFGWWLPEHRFPDQPGLDNSSLSAPERRGVFGDQFGVANALFSGLALLGVVVALVLQRRELQQSINEQREAARQHTRMLETQVLLQLIGEIRQVRWGRAYAALINWRREHPNDFAELFIQGQNKPGTDGYRIDKCRRIVLSSYYTIYRLVKAEIVDDAFCRIVVRPDYARTLLDVVEPMEVKIRSNYEKGPFEYLRRLYTEEELEQEGSYMTAKQP
jgi:hypothetical protein